MFQYEKSWWQSKKVWAALIAAALICAKAAFPHFGPLQNLNDAHVTAIALTAISFILGQAKVDADVRSAAIANSTPPTSVPGLTNEKGEN